MTALTARVRAAFPRGTFKRHVLVLAGGTALAQGLAAAAAPVISRLYGPSDFGVLSVYFSIVSVLLSVASLRYEIAIPLPETDDEALQLVVMALLLVPAMGLLSVLAFRLLGDDVLRWTGTTALRKYWWTVPVSLVTAGTYQVLSYWAVRKHAFSQLARTRIGQAVGQVVAQVGLGIAGFVPAGLLVGDIIGRTSGTATLATLAFRGEARLRDRVSLARVLAAGKRYARFPLFASSAGLLNTLATYLPPVLLAGFYGPSSAGWFHLGQRLVGIPLTLIGTSMSQVYLGEAARLARENPRGLKPLFLSTGRRLLLLTAGPVALLALVGPLAFAFVLGEPWREAGEYVRVLSLMFLLQFVCAPLSPTLNMLEHQHWQFGWDMARLLLTLAALVGAHQTGHGAVYALGLYGTAMAVGYLALFLLSIAAIDRLVRDRAPPAAP